MKFQNPSTHGSEAIQCIKKHNTSGWPRTLENRENGGKKFPAGKNQGI